MTKRDGKQMRLIHFFLHVFTLLMLNHDPVDDIARAGDNRLISTAPVHYGVRGEPRSQVMFRLKNLETSAARCPEKTGLTAAGCVAPTHARRNQTGRQKYAVNQPSTDCLPFSLHFLLVLQRHVQATCSLVNITAELHRRPSE